MKEIVDTVAEKLEKEAEGLPASELEELALQYAEEALSERELHDRELASVAGGLGGSGQTPARIVADRALGKLIGIRRERPGLDVGIWPAGYGIWPADRE